MICSSLIYIFAFFIGIAMTFATTFINRPFNDVVKESPLIVRGRAADQYTDWGKGGSSKAIFTYTQFIITEVLKGDLKETSILLRQPGGEKDGVELHVPGAAIFNRDEELVVLLGAFDAADKSYDVIFVVVEYGVACIQKLMMLQFVVLVATAVVDEASWSVAVVLRPVVVTRARDEVDARPV